MAAELASEAARCLVADDMKVNPGTRFDAVGRSGIYPASGPWPPGKVPVRGQGALAHPEERGRVFQRWRNWPGNSAMLALGRALLGGYFLYNGINHFANRRTLSEYARSKHVPAPDAAVSASGALILLGGLSVLSGMHPKIGASMALVGAACLVAALPEPWPASVHRRHGGAMVTA